jgi:hypothetical protein
MLTIHNTDKFKMMLCNGKFAHKVDMTPNQLGYVFYFRVSDFNTRVQNAYKLNGDDVAVCLDRTPNAQGKYKLFIIGYATRVKMMVDIDDLQMPYLLASQVTELIHKLQRIC